MTARQFWKLPRAERTRVYFEHDSNTSVNKKTGMKGPTLRAQADFINNYLEAFFRFANTLSPR